MNILNRIEDTSIVTQRLMNVFGTESPIRYSGATLLRIHAVSPDAMANSTSPCTLTLCSGTHYDLSSLSSAKSDYTAKVGKLEYKLNVCREVVSELWHVEEPDKVGAFVSRDGGDFSMG